MIVLNKLISAGDATQYLLMFFVEFLSQDLEKYFNKCHLLAADALQGT